MASASRRLRAFKRWMKSQGIECVDALELTDSPEEGVAVRALRDLKEGDVVSTIPKSSCLTIKTSGANEIIESASLDGCLGLSVALMYERSLGEDSQWAGYLQILPHQECLPLVWSLDEVDSLLCGTELHKTIKEDKTLIYEDWRDNILPLMDSSPTELNPRYFGVEEYFAARSLIASRSFQIDDYHGSGMVPLADLFNHKTGAEDVHFTSHGDSDNDTDSNKENDDEDDDDDNESVLLNIDDNEEIDDDDDYGLPFNAGDIESTTQNTAVAGENSLVIADTSSVLKDDPMVLEMIMVKDVKPGVEVFNTYGMLGNAALLHRYGFTEANNPYDIVNIDLDLVLQWSSSLFSDRLTRARLSLWRRLDYSGFASQNSDYFEISSDGEPEIELLVLLYIILLPDDAAHNLDLAISSSSNKNMLSCSLLSGKHRILFDKTSEKSKDSFLSRKVCGGLVAVADMRDSLYGLNSVEDDIKLLKSSCCIKERKLYHSLMLRVSERTILKKLRTYADRKPRSSGGAGKKTSMRKRLKKT